LGPYSFRVFVDAAWSQQHLDQYNAAPKAVRRKKIPVGRAILKRPLAAAIPSAQSNKGKPSQFILEPSEPRMMVILLRRMLLIKVTMEGR
jgi:hypothetical protein